MMRFDPLLSASSLHSLRLLLAALLLFGSEVLVWNNPPERAVLEWLLIMPGYLALSAVLLDFIVRYRVRDLFGVLVLAGIYSLSAALILNPQLSFADMPRTLVTRVMGANGLLAAEMIGLFLALTGGDSPKTRRYLWVGGVVVGLAWGFWVNGWPLEAGYSEVSLVTMAAYGVIGLVVMWALSQYVAASSLSISLAAYERSENSGEQTVQTSPENLKLSPRGWSLIVVVLAALFIVRLVQGAIDGAALALTLLLLVLGWGIIWYRGRVKGATLLDGHFPSRTLPFVAFFITAMLFMVTAIFAFNLPAIQVAEVTPLMVIGVGFTAYGLAWLPTVSLVLGARAYLRQIQTQKF